MFPSVRTGVLPQTEVRAAEGEAVKIPFLCNGAGYVVTIIQNKEWSELHVAFDITHDPWRTLAMRVLSTLVHDTEEFGDDAEEVKNILRAIAADESQLQ
jgi:hypothetical protein